MRMSTDKICGTSCLIVGKGRAKLVQGICHWCLRLRTVVRLVPETDVYLALCWIFPSSLYLVPYRIVMALYSQFINIWSSGISNGLKVHYQLGVGLLSRKVGDDERKWVLPNVDWRDHQYDGVYCRSDATAHAAKGHDNSAECSDAEKIVLLTFPLWSMTPPKISLQNASHKKSALQWERNKHLLISVVTKVEIICGLE